jgi:SAM-dependent methyltransferase
LDDASVDVVVSALMLNFVSDSPAALAEMKRVSVPGGTVAAYVWDYAGKMEVMRVFWDEAVALNPAAGVLDEGVRFPLCQADQLARLFASCGLDAVETEGITISTPFTGFEAYWQPFLGGQGPAPAYAMSLDETARGRLAERIRRRLESTPGGFESLTARAWAVRGRVVK